ncbi:MAG: hypothetical protein C4520_11000 [Candidatus Abyssobacteria bacterium SURF_5]|uniref:O-antigen ligase-related domain-containing protein n=1 Tax=Abyssobacteria bacterium (strain SURF_5) TaxID=2093360 RepID=A0A3A4NRI8_ABYX5|nr:MAG: hypothetical protein C4520_11000 [Candidatus Abyssubacteria bacterium SURF_5]
MMKSTMGRRKETSNIGLFLIILYMFFEYVRPQSFIAGLAPLHIPMIVQSIIILSLFSCDFERFKKRETVYFFLLLCLMAAHVPFATNNYWAYQITRSMTLQFVVFLAIIGHLHTFHKLGLVLTLWIAVAILCSIAGIAQGGRIPESGFLGDENDFALFLNMMIPLAFFSGQAARSKRAKLFYYSGVAVLILGTVSSMSRGGFLGMLPPLLYCWWKTDSKLKTGIAAALVGSLLVVSFIPDKYWTEMSTIQEEGLNVGTGSQRAYLWRRGFEMFQDHPLIGVGPGNFNWNLRYYEPPDGFAGRSHAGRPSHSIYFTMLPELGMMGTFLILGLTWVSQMESRRLNKTIRKRLPPDKKDEETGRLEAFGFGFTGAVLAYLVSGAFLSVLYYGHFWLIIGFTVATNRLLKERLHQLADETESPKRAYHESSDNRWQYARRIGNHPFAR